MINREEFFVFTYSVKKIGIRNDGLPIRSVTNYLYCIPTGKELSVVVPLEMDLVPL